MDTELNQEWLPTLSDPRLAGRVFFKRCYAEGLGGNEVKSLQLHCFADASEKACGAVVYEVRPELLRDTSRSLRVFFGYNKCSNLFKPKISIYYLWRTYQGLKRLTLRRCLLFFLKFPGFFQKHTSISSDIKSQTTAFGKKGFSVVS